MAKPTEKSPSAEQSGLPTSFPVPEVTPTMPRPADLVAATIPRLPEGDQVTAGQSNQQKLKPALPSGKADYDPGAVQRTKANLNGPILTMTRPVLSRLSTLGTELLGRCAMANGVGQREPTHALVTFSDDRQWLYLMPTVKHDKAVEISYHAKQANINLWGPFEETGKMVEKGYKEIYDLNLTEVPITIHGVKGFALYIYLVEPKKEAIQPREESATTPRTTKESGKASASKSTKAKADAAEASTDQTEQLQKFKAQLDERDHQLEARDAQIDELMAQLQAYKEKYGNL